MDFNIIIPLQTISIYPFSYVSLVLIIPHCRAINPLTPPRTRKRDWLFLISLHPPIPSVPDVSMLALRNALTLRYPKLLRMRSKPRCQRKHTDVCKPCVLSFLFCLTHARRMMISSKPSWKTSPASYLPHRSPENISNWSFARSILYSWASRSLGEKRVRHSRSRACISILFN